MMKYIKTMPLIVWIKWFCRAYRTKRRNPTLSIGVYSEAHNCKFGHRNIIYKNTMLVSVALGDYTYVGCNCKIQYASLGKFCSIAEGVRIGLGIHPIDLEMTHPAFYSPQSHWKEDITPVIPENLIEYKRVQIGDDVWIGTGAMIMDGVTIADHAVIAAGAVVTKDVPKYAIVGGVPAKVIKFRKVK